MSFTSFHIQLDECTFLMGSKMFEKESFSYPGTLDDLIYNNGKDNQIELVVIKVTKKIYDTEFYFYSPPCSNSVDDLRIRIEFLKSVVVYYDEQNPKDYYFKFL